MSLFQTGLVLHFGMDTMFYPLSFQLVSRCRPAFLVPLLFSPCDQPKKGLGSLALLTLWALWQERNNRIFRQAETLISRFIILLKEEVRLWAFAGAKHLGSLVDPFFA